MIGCLYTTPSEIARKTEAMDTASQKVESAEEGAVGGEVDIDPDRHPGCAIINDVMMTN